MSRNRNFNDGRQRSAAGPVLNQGRGLLGEAPSVHNNFGSVDRGLPGVNSNFRQMDRGVPGVSSNFRSMDRGSKGVASNFGLVDRGGTLNLGLLGNPQTSQGRLMAMNINQGMMNQSSSGRMDNKSFRDNQLQMVSELLKQQQQLQQQQQTSQQLQSIMRKLPASIMGKIPTGLIGSGGQGLLGNFSNLVAKSNMIMTSSGNRKVAGIMGNPPALGNRNRQNTGNWSGIPSIFELQVDRSSGKRPGGFSSGSDNKRMRRGHSPDNQRGRYAQDNRRRNSDHHPDGQRDQNRHHSQDRQDRSRDHSSESYKQDRDKKDTSVHVSSHENAQRKVKVEVEDVVIGGINLEQKEDNEGLTEEYDPASPTGDVEQSHDDSQQSEDDNMEDAYEELDVKSVEPHDHSEAVKVDIEMKDKATSGLTVTFDKKGRSVQDPDKKADDKKEEGKQMNFVCHACNISCYNEKSFTHHMKGMKHKKRMEELMNMHKQKSSQMFARLKAESHLRRIENQSTSNDGRARKDDNHGPRQTSKRRNRAAEEGKLFDEELSQDDIDQLVTVDTVGYEDDLMFESPDEMEGVERTFKAYVTDEDQNSQEHGNKDWKESDIVIPDKYDPNVPLGQKFVIPVSGFFCKLCHRFYSNETVALVEHCQSVGHFEKYKKAMLARAISIQQKKEAILKEMQMDSDNSIPQSDSNIGPSSEPCSSVETTDELEIKKEMSPTILKAELQSPQTKENTEDQGSQESAETEGTNCNTSLYYTAPEDSPVKAATLKDDDPIKDDAPVKEDTPMKDDFSVKEDIVEEEEEEDVVGEEENEDLAETDGNSPQLGKGRGRGRGRGRRGRRGRK